MSFDLSHEEIAAAVGPWATAAESYELLTVDVPAEHWIEALTACRDGLGLRYFDWLSAVDELGEGFSVCAHLARVGEGATARLLLRTRVPREAATLPTAVGVYAGAAWHERETHEMFGIGFEGHPHLVTLLLPDGFEGYPLRKEFVLAARVAKAWPGAKEPGESDHAPAEGARRRMLPPGVPDPNEWGPLKGTLPPAPERPARGARAAAAGPAADRPRRTRSVSSGSTSQTEPQPATPDAPWQSPEPPTTRPRRARSVSDGSVSQPPPEPTPAPQAAQPEQAEDTAPTTGPASAAAPGPAVAGEPAPAAESVGETAEPSAPAVADEAADEAGRQAAPTSGSGSVAAPASSGPDEPAAAESAGQEGEAAPVEGVESGAAPATAPEPAVEESAPEASDEGGTTTDPEEGRA
ncbi:NADH-quinone oxidoreductase subunit C [Streptacidiphilus rugosus]|uniref:NADH-quinone oxidoreductase subunit C n=1 Tax=Streptacidiphilus rugosus TaxID=405783 RepID=UPI00068BBD2B|nr:NADH-quinone oxidoreductase subunit C [Streptacidiphilus rugosus]